jgi:transcriptional regulator of heat shock response
MKQELSPRQKQILYYLAKEQIESFEPVASIQIKEKYNLDFSPATIRHELFELCQMEYLEQPHTSAGRILSDIGWEILINDFLNIAWSATDLMDLPEDYNEFAQDLSQKTQSMSIVFDWKNNKIYKKGISFLLNEKVVNNIKELTNISNIIDKIDDSMQKLKKILFNKEINVYIGKNNPLFTNQHLAFIGTKSDKDQLIIAIITPKITNYEEQFSLFSKLINTLN